MLTIGKLPLMFSMVGIFHQGVVYLVAWRILYQVRANSCIVKVAQRSDLISKLTKVGIFFSVIERT